MNTAVSERKGHDIREDEEQGIKQQEIIDLLVAAGYFRARIKGLSSFDKIVGGMVWCMESCYYDVDVDLLFQENSTIGQKIALTEKIVTVLPRMGCPHLIEPHQIQGLDFIHIFPVIQWLVKQSVTVREEKREFLRESSVRDFNRRFRAEDSSAKIMSSFFEIQERYRPKRVLRRKGNPPEDESQLVDSTLMEYGFFGGEAVGGNEPDEKSVQQSFEEIRNRELVLPKGALQAIVSSQSEAIAAVSEQFASVTVEEDAKAHLERQKEMLIEEKNSLEKEVEDLIKERDSFRQGTRALSQNQGETNNNVIAYTQLEELVILEESLRKQEQEFKEHCREELERLQNLIKEAEKPQDGVEDVDIVCETEKTRIANLRLQIARKSRAVSQLQRRLDEIPGRAELAQYQKRFIELYNLVAQKHAETKQFYTMYNTLDDTRLYLVKELNLLNSVLDTYSKAMTSSLDKTLFIQQFEGIVTAVKQNKAKVETRRDEEFMKRDELSHELQELVELQRHYVSVVKQLKQEIRRNEALLAQLRPN